MVVEDWMIRTGLALLALNAVNGLLFWGIRRRNRRLRRPPATTRETTSAPDGDPVAHRPASEQPPAQFVALPPP
jgi:hypothetical protein